MSLISSIKEVFRTKLPSFVVSNFQSFQDYSHLNDSNNYLDQYESWTYKACKLKADALISYDCELYRKKGDEEVEAEDEPLYRDLSLFNPYQTYQEARQIRSIHLSLTGTAFWVMVESDTSNKKVDFYVLDPLRVQIKTDNFGLPQAYIYTDANGKQNTILPENIIYFKEPSPKNWMMGYGALQASRYAHNTLELAEKYNMNWFGNSGRPEGFLMAEGMSDDSRKRFESQLKAKYEGPRNSRKIGVLNAKVEYLEIMKTQKELDFVNSINVMRDEILALHGIPKSLAGLDDSTYTNSQEAQRVFQLYTLTPMLKLEQSVYNSQLIPKYYKKDRPDLEFKAEDCVEIDKEKSTTQAVSLYTNKLATFNEAREMVGLESKDDGDVYYEIEVPEVKVDANIDEIKSILKRQSKLIKSIPDLEDKVANKRTNLKDFYLKKNLESEAVFKTKVVEYFTGQEKRVLLEFEPKKAVTLKKGLNYDKEVTLAIEYFTDIYMKDAVKFNNIANEMTGGNIKLDADIIREIKANVEYFSKEINATTRDQLNKIIVNAIQNDLPLSEINKQIQDLYNRYSYEHIVDGEMKEPRADTIARTETNWIKNKVSRNNYSQNPFVEGMEWLATHDNAVRDAHLEADGSFASIGTKFMVGGEWLEYPGDRNGSASNTINCRCTLIAVIKE